MIRLFDGGWDTAFILAAAVIIAEREGRPHFASASELEAHLAQLDGFALIAEEAGACVGCLLVEFLYDRQGRFAHGAQLYCTKNAPPDTVHRLMEKAGLLLQKEGVERVIMTSAWGNRHKAFENMGFAPKTVVYEGCVNEILPALEKRMDHGQRRHTR